MIPELRCAAHRAPLPAAPDAKLCRNPSPRCQKSPAGERTTGVPEVLPIRKSPKTNLKFGVFRPFRVPDFQVRQQISVAVDGGFPHFDAGVPRAQGRPGGAAARGATKDGPDCGRTQPGGDRRAVFSVSGLLI
jgi:hypothetical protein